MLKPIAGGLRPVHNNSKSVAKVAVTVQPGETLHVSDDIAGQLLDARAGFAEGEAADDAPTTEANHAVEMAVADVERPAKPVKATAKASKSH